MVNMGRKRKLIAETLDDGEPVIQRSTANARERARMRVMSKAFVKLKTTLPWVPPDTKLSKLDTLRLATCYIAHLRQILAEDGASDSSTTEGEEAAAGFTHPLNLTWPFSFAGVSKPPHGHVTSHPAGDCREALELMDGNGNARNHQVAQTS